jgi:long-chain acyl-CoA synthetase
VTTPPRETLLDWFATLATRSGEYLIYDDGYRPRHYSYSQLVRAARGLAARLEAAGVGSGDRVLLWSENRPAWVAAFWAVILRGAAVVPADEKHSAEFVARVAAQVQSKAILLGDEVPGLPASPTPVLRLSELDWSAAAQPTPVPVAPDSTAEILFTSGATAEPKGVVITHRNILANAVPVEREVNKYLRYERPFHPIRFLNLLPLSHMFGQAMALIIPPMIEGVVVFQRSHNPAEIVRQIRTRRVSVLVSVPKVLEVLRDYIQAAEPVSLVPAPAPEKFWWRWWRYRRVHRRFGYKFWAFISGGAALDPALEEFWGRLGFAVIQGYGLTEAAPIVTLNHPFHARRGTVGKPIGGVELQIAPDGEVLVRGGNVASGYYNNSQATAETFEDGWLHTGDIGELDSSGRLLIKGRKKEMIVLTDGRNVFPDDIERVLNKLPGVLESAAVARQSEAGEQVHAALVLAAGAEPGEIVRLANEQLEDSQRIRGFTLWSGELPRTEGTRKLKRREIRARIAGEAPPARASAGDPLQDLLARYATSRELTPNTTLDELGLSSLERVELLVAIEHKLGVTLDENVFSSARTVADLSRLQQTGAPASAAETAWAPPSWSRRAWAQWHRYFHLNLWILPLARLFAWVRVSGRENLKDLQGPFLFASNHQGYFDGPVVFIALPWKWRHRLAPAMRKEFFDAHFYPEKLGRRAWFTNSLSYYLSCLFFNCYPIPQRETGTRTALRYTGELVEEGWCPLLFPEGKHSYDDTVGRFLPGIAVLATRLKIPVVPIRIRGSNRVLHHTWRMARPGFVDVKIGPPVQLEGDDFLASAKRLEEIVRAM